MRKNVLVSVVVLALMLVAMAPLPVRTTPPPVVRSLDFDILPAKEEFAEAVDLESTVGEVLDPTPFWVDIVNAEGYMGGEGIYVAVLDTGLLYNWQFFFTNPLTGECRIKAEWGKGFTHDIWWDEELQDFVIGPLRDDRGFITKTFEGSGHGTHVTSTIIGYRFRTAVADFWVRGVAPKATIIPVLVLDAWEVDYPGGKARFTGGTWEMVSAGIRYVAELAETYGVKIIINMSLGGRAPSPMIEEAINYAISKGVIIVAAAGNDGYAGMGWPGAYPQVISAAAGGWTMQYVGYPPSDPPSPYRWWLTNVPEQLNTVDDWGNNWQIYLEDFSSRPNKDLGQKSFHLDVTSVGAAVVGPYKPYFRPETYIGYYLVWGTSMATPHVTGIAATVLEKYPFLNQKQMETILKTAAQSPPLACDGAWVYDPFYAADPGVWPWHFEWLGTDWGAGWLTADKAMFTAYVFTRGRFKAEPLPE